MEKFIVITRTFFDEDTKDKVFEISKNSMLIFKKQPGLIKIRMHVENEQQHTLTYFEWESREAHEACMQSPDFADWGVAWNELVNSGKIRWELNTYEILDEYSA